MSNDRDINRGPERPRVEPEIIPPGRERKTPRDAADYGWSFEQREGVQRIYIARPGPFSIILGLLILGFVAALVFVVLAGIVVLWVPILIGMILLALASAAIRRWRRR
jgi:hypothetical protein